MNFRPAKVTDIGQMQDVRMSVKENVLVNKDLATDEIIEEYISRRGNGWVAEINNHLIGYGIADLLDDNIWALFVRPEFEGIGVGTRLHNAMLNWYFKQEKEKVWLITSPATKAERFCRKHGWQEVWKNERGDIRFEMTAAEWKDLYTPPQNKNPVP